jgi:hypothetical protein
MEIRNKLDRLQRMRIGAAILDRYGATIEDLELLALAEDELNPKGDNDDGNGYDMAAESER